MLTETKALRPESKTVGVGDVDRQKYYVRNPKKWEWGMLTETKILRSKSQKVEVGDVDRDQNSTSEIPDSLRRGC